MIFVIDIKRKKNMMVNYVKNECIKFKGWYIFNKWWSDPNQFNLCARGVWSINNMGLIIFQWWVN
jgi:hypothetical protein